MKHYEEIANRVLERRDEYVARQNQKRQTVMKITSVACAFALVALRSGSTLPTMLSHFINNALILTLVKLGVESIPAWFYVCSAVCLVGSLGYLIFLDKGVEQEQNAVDSAVAAKQFFLCASVGLFVYGIVWVAALFM